ncbi:TRAP transporter substrate-binding protein [Chelatococcus sp. GCM10030263]|uniref:TRAP transporter substrate-binding protein n=1 Tax=Chelatococcus sp. GCM10030263 TaxID=3273387 RepID=UPI00361485BF
MTGLTRRKLLGSSLAIAGIGAFHAAKAAPEHRLRWSVGFPATHPMVVRARQAAERIASETQGTVELQVYSDSQLGNDASVMSQVRSGAIDMQNIGGEVLSTLVPRAGMYAMGFSFPDYDTVWRAMDGDLGAYLRGEIGKSGLFVMESIWNNGFRQITSKDREIKTAEDLAGFKLRVPGSPVYITLFEALGAAPTAINWADLYPALQTGIVDGQENPLVVIQSGRLFEVQGRCSLTNHMWAGTWCIANQRRMDSLPDDVRQIVVRNVNQAASLERSDTMNGEAEIRKQLEAEGMRFNTPDLASFRERLNRGTYYASWKSRYGDEGWALLEKYCGKLG